MKLTYSFVHKASSVAVAFALLAVSFGPTSAYAAGYQITGLPSVDAMTVDISGSASANPFTGQFDQQYISVDWDDGSAIEQLADHTDLNFTDTGNNGVFTSSNWSGSHTYTAPGNYAIEVRVHHQNFNGNESSRASITFNVEVSPACSDEEDNDSDNLTDYPNDPGCSSESDTDESNDPVNTAPVITLVGANPLNITVGGTYSDPGATANDAEDGDVTGDIVVGGDTVDVNTIGTYNVTYDVEDSEGLAAVQVSRTVNVNPTVTECDDGIDNDGDGQVDTGDSGCPDAADNSENTAPVITLTGDTTINLTVGDSYVEQGATAADDEDNPDPAVVVGGTAVDTNVVGTYVITYNATDSDGAVAAEVTRTVNVNPGQTGASRYTLTVDTSGEGEGMVVGNGINCDSNFVESEETPANDCSETYDAGTQVDLTVTPDEGSSFNESWAVGAGTCTGNTTPCSVVMNSNINLNAHFTITQTTTTTGGGGGGGGGGGRRNNNNNDNDGEVLGAQTEVVPAGAPATGAGGAGSMGALVALMGAALLAASRKRA